jgi:drug/metabolite transporter (DMT)-like permease
MKTPPSRIKSIFIALIVTTIWATSWIWIKIGLEEIPALTFAGLRYTLATLFLLPFLLRKTVIAEIRNLNWRNWTKLIFLGVFLYALAQGGQFISLSLLPSVTVGLVLNLTSLFVAMISNVSLGEKPNWLQWSGVSLNLIGIVLYFFPIGAGNGNPIGWLFALISLFANVIGAVLGRNLNKGGRINPIIVTTISMGIGSILMLSSGIVFQGIPTLSLKSIGIIVLLASVNTALCFSLWNYIQQTLTATESTIINNTMLVQVAILAWLFLGEKQSLQGIIGLSFALIGAIVVQIKLNKSAKRIF